MNITTFEIQGPILVTPRAFEDERGTFMETYSKRALSAAIGEIEFVQDNQSVSKRRGTIRGLHFQSFPAAQSKLVRVTKGAVLDVAVDVRPRSPTYRAHVAVELSASNRAQLFVPDGFAHGFCTLEDDTHVLYKVDEYYNPEYDRAILWCDPDLGIVWPGDATSVILSRKDAVAPRLAEIDPPFMAWEP